jgi:O-antigen/teichoic acid export membrane protein
MTQEQKIALNAGVRWFGEALNKASWFIFIVILARKLGSSSFGYFNYAFSFGSMLVTFTDLGTNVYLVKHIARDQTRSSIYLSNILSIKGMLTIIAGLAAYCLSDHSAIVIIITAALFCSAFLDPYNSAFRAFNGMFWETLIMLFYRFLIVGIGILGLFYFQFTLVNIAWVFLIAGIASVIAAGILIHFRFGVSYFSFHDIQYHTWHKILRTSIPFGLLIIATTILTKLNVIILQSFTASTEVGWYSAAYKLIEATFFIPSILIGSIFPTLCRENIGGQISHKALILFRHAFTFLAAIAVCMAIVCSFGSTFIIHLFFGHDFFPAKTDLSILAWLPIFTFTNELLFYFFFSLDKQKIVVQIATITVGIYLSICFILIPRFGHVGAAWSILLAHIIMFSLNSVVFLKLRRT